MGLDQALIVGQFIEQGPTSWKKAKTDLLKDIGTDAIDATINPTLAALRKEIIAAYDHDNEQINTGAVKAATIKATQALTPLFSNEVQAGTLACAETASILNENVPEKGMGRKIV